MNLTEIDNLIKTHLGWLKLNEPLYRDTFKAVGKIHLIDEKLEGLNLSKNNIEEAVFDHTSFSSIDFSNSILKGTSFSNRCWFQDCNISYSNLLSSYMGTSDIEYCNFSNSRLRGGNFHHSNITNSNFSKSDLSYVNFGRTYLHNVNFENVNFDQASFYYSQFDNVNMSYATLRSNNIAHSDITSIDFTGTKFNDVILTVKQLYHILSNFKDNTFENIRLLENLVPNQLV